MPPTPPPLPDPAPRKMPPFASAQSRLPPVPSRCWCRLVAPLPGVLLPTPPRTLGSSIYSSFSYSELAKITSNFSPECVVGQGGTSQVYKGYLANGTELAVKILKYSDEVIVGAG
ncbi:hypothetical protein U9M48_028308 [Paspalum notatum var. saurae]|uniref:Protein kinase domain-containing protein n=1 Tax=Paspalum notatum var. saurae TaxID=547442 RepID=A0AAQ3TW81_PASNO